jgi:hypothetical protein
MASEGQIHRAPRLSPDDPETYAPNKDRGLQPTSGPIAERFEVDPSQHEPWLRLNDEPVRQWRAFVAYRDLGQQRSLTMAADIAGESPRTVINWSKVWEWTYRVQKFDRYIDQIAATRVASTHATMLERHASIALALQEKALLRLASMDPEELTASQTLAFLKEAVQIERDSRERLLEVAPQISQASDEIELAAQQQDSDWMGQLINVMAEAGALPEGVTLEQASEIIEGSAVAVEDDEDEAQYAS